MNWNCAKLSKRVYVSGRRHESLNWPSSTKKICFFIQAGEAPTASDTPVREQVESQAAPAVPLAQAQQKSKRSKHKKSQPHVSESAN